MRRPACWIPSWATPGLLLLLLLPPIGSIGAAQEGPGLGINVSGPADWNTERPLLDAFRFSRAWISQRAGESWGKGPPLPLDEQGWVTRLETDCYAETPLLTDCDGAVPTGKWTVLYEGRGELEFWGADLVATPVGEGRIELELKQSRGFFVRLRTTDPANHLRDIRVLPPGVTPQDVADNPWNPSFLARWKGVRCLRFMDFMHTNGSEVAAWEQRPRLTQASWTRGMPLEMMCDLANRLETDPWFCMPHLADDEYVRQFALQAARLLDPRRRVWIEYSNEVWNSQFEQHRHAARQGMELGLADQPWEAAWCYTAHRSRRIFQIWEEAFGGTERLRRVLASQAANPAVSRRVCSFQDASRDADVLAIAPYVSFSIPPEEAGKVLAMGLDGLLETLERDRLPQAIRWIREQKAIADQFGLRLAAYEGGQHLVGVRGAENNEQLTRLFHQANQHPRMGTIYEQYLQAWEEAGGDLFCAFSSVGRWSKWGSWGLMQRDGERPQDYPKFIAVMRWAQSLGQPVSFDGP